MRALPRRLQRPGLDPGPVDGRYGPRTEAVGGAATTQSKLDKKRKPINEKHQPQARQQQQQQQQRQQLVLPAGQTAEVSRERPPFVEAPGIDTERLVAAPAEPALAGPVRAVGYVSVPQANGADRGGLEAQADAIQRLCEQRGWELLRVVRDVEDGRTKGLERPGLLYALERIADGEASCLVVSHLERLTRSAADLGRIVKWFEQHQGRLVAIDLRLDTGSAEGRLTARTLAAVGEWEGRRIADQTKKGLAAARARRATTGPPTVDDRPGLKEYIVAMRQAGMTLQAIADQLNAERIPTLRGGTEWRPSSVHGAVGYRRPKTTHQAQLSPPPRPSMK